MRADGKLVCPESIGREFASEVERSEEELAALAPTLSFAFMREHKERFEPISVAWKPGFRFLRKGQVRCASRSEG